MANFLHINKIKHWDYLYLLGFQYDAVTDNDITTALQDFENLALVNPCLDWEDDRVLSNNENIPENKKHAYRVAALVHSFSKGQPMSSAIELDTYAVSSCLSCIPNGHHRIRALQYMDIPVAPFSLSGKVNHLEELVRVAGASKPEVSPYAQVFDIKLLRESPDDINLEM